LGGAERLDYIGESPKKPAIIIASLFLQVIPSNVNYKSPVAVAHLISRSGGAVVRSDRERKADQFHERYHRMISENLSLAEKTRIKLPLVQKETSGIYNCCGTSHV